MIEEITSLVDIKSLVWRGDILVDALAGYCWSLGGDDARINFGSSYRFDSVIAHKEHWAIFETFGTKAAIFRDNGYHATSKDRFIATSIESSKEIDRSYYHADVTAFPLAMGTLYSGEDVLIHCPRAYNRLDIELLDDGRLLTERSEDDDEDCDIFHSRLALSADGKFILSNGWIWQPWEVVVLYSVEQALADPRHLSSGGIDFKPDDWCWENESATFGRDTLIFSSGLEDANHLIGIVDLATLETRTLACDDYLGSRIHPVDTEHILTLHEHPRLVSLRNGKTVRQWPQLKVGTLPTQPSGVVESCVPYAYDVATQRLAVAHGRKISRLKIEP